MVKFGDFARFSLLLLLSGGGSGIIIVVIISKIGNNRISFETKESTRVNEGFHFGSWSNAEVEVPFQESAETSQGDAGFWNHVQELSF